MKYLKLTIALLMCVAIWPAHSAILSYDFAVVADGGSLSGSSASGTFSFDNTGMPSGTEIRGADLLTELDFTWNGIHYTTANANSSLIELAANGSLVRVAFGTGCDANGCVITYDQVGFIFGGGEPAGLTNVFSYSVGVLGGMGNGSTTLTPKSPIVPLPTTWALAALGLVALSYSWRKR